MRKVIKKDRVLVDKQVETKRKAYKIGAEVKMDGNPFKPTCDIVFFT